MADSPSSLPVKAISELVVSTTVDTQQKTDTVRFQWMMAGIVLTGFALCYWADPVVTSGPMKALPSLIPLGKAAGYLGWAGYKRLCDLISVLLWAVVVTILSGPIIQIAGSTSFPLVDDRLKQFDVVSTGEIVRWLQAHRAWWWISATAYWSMLPLLIAGMILPAIFRQRLAAYRFILAGTLATFITASTFARFPAAGPWTVEHYQPTIAQQQVSSQLAKLKAHKAVGRLETYAIISFPSFHTILAILCTFALSSIRWMRWLAVVLALGICVSTVTTGWHYGLDVIAGVVVALVCQGVARTTLMGARRCL